MAGYSHLTAEERDRLADLKADGLSLQAIARALGRAASTISREIGRNALESGAYRPHLADGAYMLRRQRRARLETDLRLAAYVTDRLGKAGKREYVQILRLLETFEMDHVHGAVRQALDLGAIGYDAVKHLVLCRIERRPPRLDLDCYPYLPRARVETTKPSSYLSLMSGTAA